MKLPPVTNVVADDLDALAAHSLGPDYVDELARIGFGPGMVTVEINEDAISSPARRGESDVAVIAAVRSRKCGIMTAESARTLPLPDLMGVHA